MQKKKTSQEERVLAVLLKGEKITALSALRDVGTLRLSDRIYTLKKKGWDIERKMVSSVNRFGDSISYAEYFLTDREN